MRNATTPRRGYALVVLLVLMAFLGTLMGSIGYETLLQRQKLAQRQKRLQTSWLVRAGIDIAIDTFQKDPEKYRGETLELVPDSNTVIAVLSDKESVHITAEATYPKDDGAFVCQSVTRAYRFDEKSKRLVLEKPEPADATP